jgi:signal transduction histidine kinase
MPKQAAPLRPREPQSDLEPLACRKIGFSSSGEGMPSFVKRALPFANPAGIPPRIAASVIGALVLLLICGGTAILVSLRAYDAQRWVEHTLDVQQTAQQTLGLLRDAESGERGYVITNDTSYLEPYEAAGKALPVTLQRLRQLTSDNRDQQTNLDGLEALIERRLDRLRRGLESFQRQHQIRVVPAGKELMKEVRERFDEFMGIENNLLAQRQSYGTSINRILFGLLIVSFLLSVGVVLLGGQFVAQYLRELQSYRAALETEEKRRRDAEATLQQSQKMEAVGQLTGGVAHDFNNLLTVILGGLDTVQRRIAAVPIGQDASHFAATLNNPVNMALQGCRRAAQLTHRLLAFSQKQTLEPSIVDLNNLVSGMTDLLRRTVSEAVTVETVLGGGLWSTRVDVSQIENSLVNLVINARDAMPNGGRLTIETANAYLDENYVKRFGGLVPGQYVLLSVTDSGTGISAEIIDRVFEPFFTTKGPEKGSGLGLAMIHGFVKQSSGHIRIYSEPGHGTTVKIYLPRFVGPGEMRATPVGVMHPTMPLPRSKPNETILVVEDNEGVRNFAVSVLEDLGYRVIEAADADQALQHICEETALSLLFTDVVLPAGFSGRMLADQARAMLPGLPVLYTTGYTRNAIVHNAILDPGVQLLNKPYTQAELAGKIRQVLETPAEKPL